MQDTLAPGLARTERLTVDGARSIDFLGEANRVYATPSMINDVEYACLRLLAEHLDEGESSVGVHVAMDHLGATPIGNDVEIRVEVTEVDARKITLVAEIRDDEEIVGRGRHQRFVIDVARQSERIRAKAERLRSR